MPCDNPVGCACNRNTQLACKYWEPSRNSKYFYCENYHTNKMACPYEVSDCENCPFFAKGLKSGRPNKTDVDWNDPESVNEYRRNKRNANARECPEAIRGSVQK